MQNSNFDAVVGDVDAAVDWGSAGVGPDRRIEIVKDRRCAGVGPRLGAGAVRLRVRCVWLSCRNRRAVCSPRPSAGACGRAWLLLA